MKFHRRKWGKIEDRKVELVTITDDRTDFEVSITNLGASLVSVRMPDRNGEIGNIHLGRLKPQEFFADDAHYGSTIGRCTSIIPFGEFEINGELITLTKNQMKVHNFHGGFMGFDRKIWDLRNISEAPDRISLIFEYLSKDGEEGYPGNLQVELTYVISPLSISWAYKATTDKSTVVNLTNHAYWNLEGPEKTVKGHSIQVQASRFQHVRMGEMIRKTLFSVLHFPVKNKKSPVEVRLVENHGPDLREVRKISEIFKTHGNLDTVYLLDTHYDVTLDTAPPTVAQLYCPATGRSLEMKSSEPALIVYSGNSMKGTKVMGRNARKHGAICLEPIRPIDAIHSPEFRELVILNPGETYTHLTRVNFSVH